MAERLYSHAGSASRMALPTSLAREDLKKPETRSAFVKLWKELTLSKIFEGFQMRRQTGIILKDANIFKFLAQTSAGSPQRPE
jgi:hypothetical protein